LTDVRRRLLQEFSAACRKHEVDAFGGQRFGASSPQSFTRCADQRRATINSEMHCVLILLNKNAGLSHVPGDAHPPVSGKLIGRSDLDLNQVTLTDPLLTVELNQFHGMKGGVVSRRIRELDSIQKQRQR
jgi:hypothetical protein